MPPIPIFPNRWIIAQLTSEPLNFPGVLAKALAEGVPDLCLELLKINLRSLRENDKPRIDVLDQQITKYLQDSNRKPLILSCWFPVRKRLLEFCEFGVTGPVETIAAMILAGAAIHYVKATKKLQLRSDLDKTLQAACTNTKILHPFEEGFKKFKILSTQPNSLLAKKILEILTQGNVPPITLRLGKELSTLNLIKIEDRRKLYFTQPQIFAQTGNRKGTLKGNLDILTPELTAPKNLEIKLVNAHCDQQQESSGDEIFWISYFSQLANLQDVYLQIDKAIKSGDLQTVNLNIQMKVTTKRSSLYSFSTGQNRQVNFPVGSVELIQGFGPWHCDLVCYEDDDEEYKKVEEVFDEIGEYASYVQQGAQVVVAVSGPTVVAAGAAVVAVGAKAVQLCAEVGSAITKIANFFDDNDYIGSKTFNGQTDYVRMASGLSPFPESSLGRFYTIKVVEDRKGQEKVTRNWEVISTYGEGKKEKNSSDFGGVSENFDVEFEMNTNTDKIMESGVRHVCKEEAYSGDDGWAKWKRGPHLDINKRTITGEIHVGQDAGGHVEDTPWVQGFGLLYPPL